MPQPAAVRGAATPPPAQIQVPFVDPTGDFYVKVSAGGGPFKRVVFDAGSIGMHIIAKFAGPGIKRTTTAFKNAYADGTQYEGVMGYGPVSLNGEISTSSKTPIGLIQKISCIPTVPNCPGKGGIAGAIKLKRFGVMGVRFSGAVSGLAFDSALGYLPAPYNEGFVVTRDTLYLGLTPEVRGSFRTIALEPLPGANGNGFPAWENAVPVNWYLNGRLLTGKPLRTIFDTGTSQLLLGLPKGAIPSSFIGSNGQLASGLSLDVTAPGVFDDFITTGTQVGVNSVAVVPPSVAVGPYANTGWSPFNVYDVLYDPIHGLEGFRPHLPLAAR